MKRAILCAFVLFGGCGALPGPRFEKVSDHCYYLQSRTASANVSAVITDEGILIVNPPPEEADIGGTVEALKRVSAQAVRWVAGTDPRFLQGAGARYFAEKGAVVLASAESSGSPAPRMVFGGRMRLFPSGVEIRIAALEAKALSGSDVIIAVPDEKVLFVGGLYEAARYPDIDPSAPGSALDWIDALKQAIELTPVYKPAIPKSKPDPKVTLEEGVTVVSSRGECSNLQNMKDLLEACQKLRNDLARAVKSGTGCEGFLESPASDPYRSYDNLASFAGRLCEALSGPAD